MHIWDLAVKLKILVSKKLGYRVNYAYWTSLGVWKYTSWLDKYMVQTWDARSRKWLLQINCEDVVLLHLLPEMAARCEEMVGPCGVLVAAAPHAVWCPRPEYADLASNLHLWPLSRYISSLLSLLWFPFRIYDFLSLCGVLNVTCSDYYLVFDVYAKGEVQV
jgi:hypothetical protein